MDDVIAQAKKLAQMLASHERATAFRAAAAAVEADPEASRIQRAYAQAIEAVREREVAGQPVEPEHKRALMTAADAVRKSDKLVVMLQAHAAYAEMMETVQAILSGMTDEDGGHEHGPGCDHDHDHGHGDKPEEPPQKSVLWTP
ncbi:MAG: YlbF family regulator [Planctomycetota bacterium]